MSSITESSPPAATDTHATIFLTCWRKLPDELKLEVLRHALLSGHPLSAPFFDDRYSHTFPTFTDDILPILACPEVASLGLEVRYRQNVVVLTVRKSYRLPPVAARKYVHSWHTNLQIEVIYSPSFHNLAKTFAGFPIAHELSLFISHTSHDYATEHTTALETIRTRLMEMDTLHFHTKKLSIVFSPESYRVHLIDGFDEALQAKMTIIGPEESITSECKRTLYTVLPRRGENPMSVVKKWPTGMIPNTHFRETEITVSRG